jgi:hypothetical protein
MRRERLVARLPRLIATVAVAALALVGVRVIVFGTAPPRPAPIPMAPSVDLAAHGFAVEVVRAYLTWDAARPERQAQALASVAGGTVGADLGLTPPARASQQVLWADVVQDQEALAGGRLITVAAMTDVHGLLDVSVPVRRDAEGGLSLGGYPALIGAPLSATASQPPLRRSVEDAGVRRVAARAVGNYLAGDGEDLQADLARGAKISLPSLSLRMTDLVDVAELGPDGVLVTVHASSGDGAQFTLAYELGITRAERVYVTSIQAFPDQP